MKEVWLTKLAAWLHDPAEKALILLRSKTGHEWGTVAALREELFGSRDIPAEIQSILQRADRYAAAADRPQWPREEYGTRYAAWSQVDFAVAPVLIHPLTGAAHELAPLKEIASERIEAVSLDHFKGWILRDAEGRPDFQRTHLAYWRFGPSTPAPELNHLWQNLPADTRVPDHSIWTHLDLVSAFAGAMAADAGGTPALLAVSFGPVQGFIAEARSTSDLWAGSHLLSRIAWEGMKVVCERHGPDAIIFPNLRGVPMVDHWLRNVKGLPAKWFQGEDWVRSQSDANPLFAAALPNRFVAIVPADEAAALAAAVEARVRGFVAELGERTLRRILAEIEEPWREDLPCVAQMQAQLDGFPEVYWAAVPWSLAEGPQAGGRYPADDGRLRTALSAFYPEGERIGFLDDEVWRVLARDIQLAGARFYEPNPGVLYPAIYDLLDRVAAAAKTARPFAPLDQVGYRSSLNGEREWLTLDRAQLTLPPGSRTGTLWTRLADMRRAWVREGEHLDALSAIKRLWPTLFTEEVSAIVGRGVRRYVVSTHTMALAVSLERLMEDPAETDLERQAALATLMSLTADESLDAAALPRKLALAAARKGGDFDRLACNLPALLDRFRDADDEAGRRNLEVTIEQALGARPETYYGLILMDGDRMGAWLSNGRWRDRSGQEIDVRLVHEQCWHERIRASDVLRQLRAANPELDAYLKSKRPPSPGRHAAISTALNAFSLKTARFVVEDCFKGKLLYAGGDDVLALVCVDDLLPAMTLLRCLYSGHAVPQWLASRLDDRSLGRFESGNGWLRLDDELFLTMGDKATASCGAVVAHHQTPLGMVLRALREAEDAAKKKGDRDAFSLRILKRAGGEVGVTDKWWRPRTRPTEGSSPTAAEDESAVGLLDRLMRLLARKGVSRRAVYNTVEWLAQLPERPAPDLLAANLAYQFARQANEKHKGSMRAVALELASYVSHHHPHTPTHALTDLLLTGEFLARNCRQEETV